jgi:gliding motility-associated-like protein
MLPFDYSICEDSTTITGNLPAGTTASWVTIEAGDATIVSMDNVTTLDGLTTSVTLSYTLSAPGCENYSTDTITVTREDIPVAVDDNLTITGNMGIGNINLLTNDQRTGPVTVTLLDEAPFGEVIFLNGDFTLDAGAGISGEFVIRYEICSNSCADLCDEGQLTVRVDADGERPPVYNAITPNGDGLNETFIFDVLAFNPEDFPENELIIFNRWGDILYEAKPYNNDWNGLNDGGQEVPEGTYYYILRLNLGEGDIIRGDVTVIR